MHFKVKYLFIILVTVILSNCNKKVIKDLTSDTNANITVVESTTLYSDIIKEQKFELKNGYTLIFRPILFSLNNNEPVNAVQICLESDKQFLILKNWPYFDMLKYYPRYENIDFDDYFVSSIYFGAYYSTLYEKATGKEILTAISAAADTDNNLLIYLEQKEIQDNKDFPSAHGFENLREDKTPPSEEQIILYDFKNKKRYPLTPYLIDESKLQYNNGPYGRQIHYYNHFSFDKVTDDYIYITYDGDFDVETQENIIQHIEIKR